MVVVVTQQVAQVSHARRSSQAISCANVLAERCLHATSRANFSTEIPPQIITCTGFSTNGRPQATSCIEWPAKVDALDTPRLHYGTP